MPLATSTYHLPLTTHHALTTHHSPLTTQVNARTLGRYQAVGRVCGLALVNRVTLGLPFARYFLCLVMGEAPTELPELQRELAEEDPSLLSEAVFLSQVHTLHLAPHTSHLYTSHRMPYTSHPTSHTSHTSHTVRLTSYSLWSSPA